MGWFSPNSDCNCGCPDCSGCLPFESVSFSSASGATGGRCSGGFNAYNGTHVLLPVVGVECTFSKRHSTVMCGANLELVETNAEIFKAADAPFSNVPLSFPYSTGFRIIVYPNSYGSNYGSPRSYIFYKDFEFCPSGTHSLTYYGMIAGTMPITASAPTSVSVTWP